MIQNRYVQYDLKNRSCQDCGCEDGEATCSLTPDNTCDLLLPGTAKWWIRTQNNQGLGPWSDRMKFTVTENECNGDSSD